MGVVSPEQFEELLANLGREEFVAFVADLWAARDMETAVSGQTVVCSPESERESLRIHVGYRVGLPATVFPGIGESSRMPEAVEEADVLVTNVDWKKAQNLATATDTKYVRPDQLREILLYAIDRSTAEDLCLRYFNCSLDTERQEQTISDRLRDRFDCGPTSPLFATQQSEIARELATAVVVFALAIAIPFVAVSLGISPATGVASSLQLTEHPGGETVAESPEQTLNYPPGISESGIANLTALSSAHATAVGEATFQLGIHHDGTRGAVVTTGRWRTSRQYISKQARDEYRYTVEGIVPPESIGGDPAAVHFDVTVNRTDCTSRVGYFELESESSDPCLVVSADDHQLWAHVTTQYLDRYLHSGTGGIQVLDRGPSPVYRIVVSEPPPEMTRPVSNYTAVAVVTESGFVRELSVSYTTPTVDRSGPVSFSFRFENESR